MFISHFANFRTSPVAILTHFPISSHRYIMELERKVNYLQHLLGTSHPNQGGDVSAARSDQGLNVGSPASRSQSLHSEEHVRTYYAFKFRLLMRLPRLLSQ